jgi:hypothetical protein
MTIERLAVPRPTVGVLLHAGVPQGQTTGPLGRLMVLLAQRYGLDPALKHLEVISTRQGPQVYITADGWRVIAQRSDMLDGITHGDISEGEHGWRATVHVWRKDCRHCFDGRAGCGYAEQADPDDCMATAVTRATRRALKNAFDARVVLSEDERTLVADTEEPPVVEASPSPPPAAPEPEPVVVEEGEPDPERPF